MFDIVSYLMGKKGAASSEVELYGDIVCTDDGEGNITIIVSNSNNSNDNGGN